MTSPGHGPDPSLREACVHETIALLASFGAEAVDVYAVADGIGRPADAVAETFPDQEALLVAAADELAKAAVIASVTGANHDSTVTGAIDAILREHRRFVASDPTRFRALMQLAGAAAFGRRRLLRASLAARNRRVAQAVEDRLGQVHRAGLTSVAAADVLAIGSTLVDSMVGIEMCHALDGDEAVRDAAYESLAKTITLRLAGRSRNGGPPTAPTIARMRFEPDYRMTFVLEPSGIVRDVLAVSGVRGWDARAYLGRSVADIATDRDRGEARAAVWRDRLEQLRHALGPVSFQDIRPGEPPSARPRVTVTLTPIRQADGQLESILVDAQDHSARLDAEQASREAQDSLDSALGLTKLGRYTTYLREIRMDADARFNEIYGQDAQELIEREGIEGFFTVIHAEDRLSVRAALEAAMTGEVDYITNYRLWAKRPDGPELRWIEALGRVERDEEGPLRVVGVIEDVTERRKYQESRLRNQKREAIGTLAAGIAHDFNNVIGAVLSNAEIAEAELGRGVAPTSSIHEINRGALRAAELVKRLLAFSREDEPARAAFDLALVVREACALIRPTLGADVTLQQSLASPLPSAVGDAGQLHQAVINLVVNADQAIGPNRGLIEVSLDVATLDRSLADAEALPPGEYLRLRVRDDGPGIPERLEQRIFDPFFSTKPIGHGTGLGLPSTQAIVSSHGGAMSVESEVGQGALFTVYLPASVLAVEPRTELLPTMPAWEPRERRLRMLLVDDETALTRVAERGLPAYGCQVVSFSSPAAALASLRGDPDGFDLVVTDLAMPGMNGIELIRHVRELRPTLPIILTSGYVTPAAEEQARGYGVRSILEKPWTVSQLAVAMLDVVGKLPQERPRADTPDCGLRAGERRRRVREPLGDPLGRQLQECYVVGGPGVALGEHRADRAQHVVGGVPDRHARARHDAVLKRGPRPMERRVAARVAHDERPAGRHGLPAHRLFRRGALEGCAGLAHAVRAEEMLPTVVEQGDQDHRGGEQPRDRRGDLVELALRAAQGQAGAVHGGEALGVGEGVAAEVLALRVEGDLGARAQRGHALFAVPRGRADRAGRAVRHRRQQAADDGLGLTAAAVGEQDGEVRAVQARQTVAGPQDLLPAHGGDDEQVLVDRGFALRRSGVVAIGGVGRRQQRQSHDGDGQGSPVGDRSRE
jgi:PAS domain S-box-containing protein